MHFLLNFLKWIFQKFFFEFIKNKVNILLLLLILLPIELRWITHSKVKELKWFMSEWTHCNCAICWKKNNCWPASCRDFNVNVRCLFNNLQDLWQFYKYNHFNPSSWCLISCHFITSIFSKPNIFLYIIKLFAHIYYIYIFAIALQTA